MPYVQQFGINKPSPLAWWGSDDKKEESNQASDIIENNNKKSGGWFSTAMDYAQEGLGWAGMLPGVGAAADLINAGISGGRAGYAGLTGDTEGLKHHTGQAALNLAFAVPGAGDVAAGVNKLGKVGKAIKYADSAYASTKPVKFLKNIGKEGSYLAGKMGTQMLKTGPGTQVARVLGTGAVGDTTRALYNFATQKKGILGSSTAKNYASKTINKLSSGIAGYKGKSSYDKMADEKKNSIIRDSGVAPAIEGVYAAVTRGNKNIKALPKDITSQSDYAENFQGSGQNKKSFKEAYKKADKTKYKTLADFTRAAQLYNKKHQTT